MMKKGKITAIPERKKDTYLTAVLSLPLRMHERAWLFTCGRSISTSLVKQILEVSQDGVVFGTENTVYHVTYAHRPAEIEVICA